EVRLVGRLIGVAFENPDQMRAAADRHCVEEEHPRLVGNRGFDCLGKQHPVALEMDGIDLEFGDANHRCRHAIRGQAPARASASSFKSAGFSMTLSPQPHSPVWFGLVKVKPDLRLSSSKSMT